MKRKIAILYTQISRSWSSKIFEIFAKVWKKTMINYRKIFWTWTSAESFLLWLSRRRSLLSEKTQIIKEIEDCSAKRGIDLPFFGGGGRLREDSNTWNLPDFLFNTMNFILKLFCLKTLICNIIFLVNQNSEGILMLILFLRVK